ncbi:MAG: FecR domain-containing protein [Tannerellaceae bacterium]|nr:FecR domain-containing protein [Tannerellaceae bacterium]
MSKKYVKVLIKEFADGDLPDDVKDSFGAWLTDGNDCDGKRDAMEEYWEGLGHTAGDDAKDDLKEVWKRINGYKGGSYRMPVYKKALIIAAAVMLPLLTALLTYNVVDKSRPSAGVDLVEYFVPNGERRHIILPDGTEVWINSGSLLITQKDFNTGGRTLFLNGEASFNVARDEKRPFTVRTEDMDITALGTIFNIRSYPDGVTSVATLESGKVKINTKHAPVQSVVILSPNEQLIYDRGTDILTTRKVIASKSARWTEGFMVFQGNSFEDIITVVERRFRTTIHYDPAPFKGRIFTVRFAPDESLTQVMDILKDIGGFKYTLSGNHIYIK